MSSCAHMGPNDFCASCAGEKLVAAQQEIEKLKAALESDSRHWKFEWHRIAADRLAKINILKQYVKTDDGTFTFPDGETIDGCGVALRPVTFCECGPYDAGCTHRWRDGWGNK